MTARRFTLAAFAFALSVTPGCQPREANSDLRSFLQPSPTPTYPESPWTLSGTIIESDSGNPLPNVLVETFRRTTLTNESGFFEFQRLGRGEVSFSKDGYEALGPFHVAMIRPMTVDVSLQRVIRAPASQVLTAVLFPNDPYFIVSGNPYQMDEWWCGPPCKVVRVNVPLDSRLRARVTWQPFGRNFTLTLAQGVGSAARRVTGAQGVSGDLTAEMSVTGGTDALVYFGLFNFDFNMDFNPANETGLPMDLQFKLTTSISP